MNCTLLDRVDIYQQTVEKSFFIVVSIVFLSTFVPTKQNY